MLREALAELVSLKYAKDSGFYEFSEGEYRERKVAAWDRARAVLARARGES